MVFSYRTYWEGIFLLPTLVSIGMLLLLSIISAQYLRGTAEIKGREFVFCAIVILLCVIPQIVYLVNGGIYLLSEKEEDQQIYFGTIQEIAEPSKRFPGYKSSHKYGADITVDGLVLFSITAGDFEEGDHVVVYYLPRSACVLEISYKTGDGLCEP